ncbi:MAG: MMPL family transporter [Planctomycetales bacterium]
MTQPATDGRQRRLMERFLRLVIGTAARFPWLTLLVALASASLAVWYTSEHLQFKISRADLIDPQTSYHQRWLNYTREFGDVSEDMVVVVEGPSARTIQQAVDDLGVRLEQEPEHFRNVLYKVDLSRLKSKALQFSSPEQLQMILRQLDEFSPLLRHFELLSLKGFFRELRYALARSQGLPPEQAARMTEPLLQQTILLVSSLDRFSRDQTTYESPWLGLASGDIGRLDAEFRDRYLMNDQETMGFVQVQSANPAADFNGAAPAIDRLRELMGEVERRHTGVRLGLTGIPVLESDEMRDSQTAMTRASILSFVGVAILLVLGLRGVRYPVLAIVMLAVGMAWSFGLTTWMVGHLNILSVSFAAMLIGLGIDFAIVFLERYIELRHNGLSLQEAILGTAESIGPGTVTAAVTTSAAFFVAVLTDFAGVAELGLIAGGGILLCMASAFLVLPALLALADRNRGPAMIASPFEGNWFRRMVSRHPALIGTLTSLAIAAIGMHGFKVRYDYNLLHLQADGLDSVETQKRIFDQSDRSLLFAVSLAENPRQVAELKKKFEALPTVHHVEELAAMLPRHDTQETQLLVQAVNAELSQLPARPPAPRNVGPKSIGEELERLESELEGAPSPLAAVARGTIDQFLDRLHALGEESEQGQARLLREYQARLAADLLLRLKGLEGISDVAPVSPDDLTPSLVNRFLSPQGKWLLQVYPASPIWDIGPLEKFITDVRSVDPEATGTPLQTFEASRAIKQSYERAGLYALAAVVLLLLFDFQHVGHCLLALLPPAVGAAAMFGIMGYCGVSLNPANMIVLPLIIGIGVDGGVHVVHDYRSQNRRYAISGSVFSAILLNSTTTMVGFGSMLIAHHRGLYSLGLVLTIGVGSCLTVALILLPAILTMVSSRPETADETDSPLEAASSDPQGNELASFPPAPHLGLAATRAVTPWSLAPSSSTK